MKVLITFFIFLMSQTLFANSVTKFVVLDDGRSILANKEGLTLYTFDVDDPGISNCHGGCLATWPAALVDECEAMMLEKPFGTIKRDSGALQLTFNSMPLYTFIGDQKPKDIRGDGLQGTWHIVEKNHCLELK